MVAIGQLRRSSDIGADQNVALKRIRRIYSENDRQRVPAYMNRFATALRTSAPAISPIARWPCGLLYRTRARIVRSQQTGDGDPFRYLCLLHREKLDQPVDDLDCRSFCFGVKPDTALFPEIDLLIDELCSFRAVCTERFGKLDEFVLFFAGLVPIPYD